MKRELIRSSSFVRAARKYIKKHPPLAEEIYFTLEELSKNAFSKKLKTHKLKGRLQDSWACSGGFDLRIIFPFVKHENNDAILLQTIGSHEEVY